MIRKSVKRKKKMIETEDKKAQLLTDQDKQVQAMPNEIDPKTVRVGVFLAMQKAKSILSRKKR